MIRLAQSVILATGFKKAVIAFCAGAFGALAMQPIGFFPALCVTMTVAVWLLDGCGARAQVGAQFASRLKCAAAAGWLLGFGYFVASLYWLGAAFFVEPDRFLWALPFGVLGVPAVLALFTALGFVIAQMLWRPGAGRILALAFGLGVSEVARGLLFTGFPWNTFGMAFVGEYPILAQTACFFGLYGLTLVVVGLCASPATLADARAPAQPRWKSPIFAAGALFLSLLIFGALRLDMGVDDWTPNVRLRIMQPNIPEDVKLTPAVRADILRKYLELSDRATSPTTAGLVNVTHLIWPESALPFLLGRDPQALQTIAAALGDHTILLTGADRLEGDSKVYNSLQVVDRSGAIVDSFDKVHLVPFGEYLPLAGWLNRFNLRQFVAAPGTFQAGTHRRLMRVAGLPPFSPLICYEAIFPGEVTPRQESGASSPRPAFLLNVTNDAWFGNTAGPYQHLAQARLRTIEEGLPLVRAANTGVSAVIDAYGRTLKQLPLGVAGVLDFNLPKPIEQPLFSHYPVGTTVIMFTLLFVACLIGRRRI